MPIEWVTEKHIWDTLRADWNRLLDGGASNSPFLRYPLQRAWWRHLGGGEWPEADLRLAAWREGGPADRIRGIAPLIRTKKGIPAIRFLGSFEIMDYLDLIALPEDMPAFVSELFEALAALPESEWQQLDFCNLRPDSPAVAALESTAISRGWSARRELLQICPVVSLPASWEEYLARLDKKQRHEIRRKVRRAESSETPISYRTTVAETLAADMASFLGLMAADPRKADFLTDAMRCQFQEIVQAACEEGILQLTFLEVDGKPAAAYLNFEYRTRTWVYNSGMNPVFAALSPGWVLLAHLIQNAIAKKHTAFDFMRGNEEYKFHWGGDGENIVRINVTRN